MALEDHCVSFEPVTRPNEESSWNKEADVYATDLFPAVILYDYLRNT